MNILETKPTGLDLSYFRFFKPSRIGRRYLKLSKNWIVDHGEPDIPEAVQQSLWRELGERDPLEVLVVPPAST